jgi:hypothetical protein
MIHPGAADRTSKVKKDYTRNDFAEPFLLGNRKLSDKLCGIDKTAPQYAGRFSFYAFKSSGLMGMCRMRLPVAA